MIAVTGSPPMSPVRTASPVPSVSSASRAAGGDEQWVNRAGGSATDAPGGRAANIVDDRLAMRMAESCVGPGCDRDQPAAPELTGHVIAGRRKRDRTRRVRSTSPRSGFLLPVPRRSSHCAGSGPALIRWARPGG